jgi:hypothetical protein
MCFFLAKLRTIFAGLALSAVTGYTRTLHMTLLRMIKEPQIVSLEHQGYKRHFDAKFINH